MERLAAIEALRLILNSSEDFSRAVELGIYDVVTARDIAGWRLARTFDRYSEYIKALRLGRSAIYGAYERFVTEFLATQGLRLPLDWRVDGDNREGTPLSS